MKVLLAELVSKFQIDNASKKSSWLIFSLYLASVLTSILFFSQGGDLNHTVTSSYAYLRGHFFDFYDYNVDAVGGNDYMPSIYIVFAIWMAPLGVFGLLTPAGSGLYLAPLELFWAKSFIYVAVLAAIVIMVQITKAAFKDEPRKQRIINLAFATSPFLIFAPLEFGQYDIFGVIFSLLGVLGLIKKNTRLFIIGFAVAISFKYFAILLFIPLALNYFQKKRDLVKWSFGALAILALEVVIYSQNNAFVNHTLFSLAAGKVADPNMIRIQILVAILFGALCIAAYLTRGRQGRQVETTILIFCSAYIPIFLGTVWHPQWIVLLAAPIALALGLMKQPKYFLMWETVAFAAYIVFVTTSWPGNVDGTMIAKGPLSFTSTPHVLFIDVIAPNVQRLAKVAMTLFFISPLLWLGFEKVRNFKEIAPKAPGAWTWLSRVLANPIFFAIPALLLALVG